MGTDKGMLMQQSNTWAQTMLDKLSKLNIPVMLSVNDQQQQEYCRIFKPDSLIVDNATLSVKGPLLGALSAHMLYPAQNLFLLACDMQLMEPSVLTTLYEQYLQTDDYDAFVFTNDNEPEPLCGIYCAKGLVAILNMYKEGSLIKYSMKFMLEHLHVCYIPASEDQKKCFKNFNAHADLNGL